MSHIISSLCLRETRCTEVCPVECINPGTEPKKWPAYNIDPSSCIDCGTCVPECPFHAIYPEDEVPSAYVAKGDELINQAGLTGHYQSLNHRKEKIVLETTRMLAPGEKINLRGSIQANYDFYK